VKQQNRGREEGGRGGGGKGAEGGGMADLQSLYTAITGAGSICALLEPIVVWVARAVCVSPRS